MRLQEANRMFSAFDIDRKDAVDFRDIMVCLRVFRLKSEDIQGKLAGFLEVYLRDEPTGRISRADAVQCLQACCHTDAERQAVRKMAHNAFTRMLGDKSIYATDITPEVVQQLPAREPMLAATIEKLFDACIQAAAPRRR
jgi:Ca2+-binding EF-hand superfamily protein